MRTAIGQVRGLGAAKEGVGHWKMQRLTAIANIVLAIWFVVHAVGMSGAGYAEWRTWFQDPYHATVMILLVASMFYHAKLGVQVVIEDYVHSEGVKIAALTLLTLVCIAFATACSVSIVMLAAGGA